MNANELADEIDLFLKEGEQLPWGTKQVYLDLASTMIRQQKVEIESLKAFYEDRLEAGRKREETLLKTIEALLRKAQEK